MNLEDFMLSEINQLRKDKYCVHLCEVPRVVMFIETEGKIGISRAAGRAALGVTV